MKKKQHYIQRAFIDEFSNDGYVFVYNKERKQLRKSRTKDVFEENNFYRIHVRAEYQKMTDKEREDLDSFCKTYFGKPFNKMNDDEKDKVEEFTEDFFADEVEPKFINTIKELKSNIADALSGKLVYIITDNIKKKLSQCLSYYFCRTKSFKHSLTKGLEDFYTQIEQIKAQYNRTRVKKEEIKVKFSKDESSHAHLRLLSNIESNDKITETIYTRKWTLFINGTRYPFIFSDKVLTIKLTKEIPAFYGVGLGTYGAEIYFPISPYIMLILNDPKAFPDVIDGNMYLINDEDRISSINKCLFLDCFSECLSNNRDYLENLAKTTEDF